MNPLLADRILRAALIEDLGAGDVSTEMLPDPDAPVRGSFLCKGEGVLAGIKLALRCYTLLSRECKVEQLVRAGEKVQPGQALARVSGPASAVLAAERVSLNLLQHLSGIATTARRWAERAAPHGIRIVDTRKTLPGMRVFEKYAVRTGSGHTHRYFLDSAVMFKDNHFAISSLAPGELVRSARQRLGHTMKLIAEATDQAMALELSAAGADVVLLDNFSPEQVAAAVAALRSQEAQAARGELGRICIEVSGGVNESNLDSYLIAGVDIISSGALTHSVRALDISLEVERGG